MQQPTAAIMDKGFLVVELLLKHQLMDLMEQRMVTGRVASFVELMALVVVGSVLATGLAFVQLMFPVLMGLVEL